MEDEVCEGPYIAFIDVIFAVFAIVAGEAGALVVFDEVNALGAVGARRALAVVHVDLAMVSLEARVGAVALVRVDTVHAQAVVLARPRLLSPISQTVK